MKIKILVLLMLVSVATFSQRHSYRQDFIDENKYYFTFDDDVPPVDTRDAYLSTLIFLLNSPDLNDNTKSKLCKEIGYVYYMKHKHESADFYFFRANEYYEMPALKKSADLSTVTLGSKKDSNMLPNSNQKFIEKILTLKYNNLSEDQIKKISKEVDQQINKLSSEKDSLILSDNPDIESIKEKEKSIGILKNTKEHLNTLIGNFKLKLEKTKLKNYLYWSLSGILLLIIIIILVLWNLRQRFKIMKQDSEIEQQLIDINKKNSYLEHAAKIIRHDMHSGINTYIPRGLNSLERRLTEQDVKSLKIEAPLKLIKDGVNHAQRVYKSVYAFTNLVKKDVILEKSRCDLKEILEGYLQNTSYKNQVTISDLVTIEVDEILFCTAVDNLIKNGLKYNNSEDKKVGIFMKDVSTLVIRDNGIGMSKSDFSKFLKPHTSEGLGINICVAILKEHGFEVSCEELQIGTEICIKFDNKV